MLPVAEWFASASSSVAGCVDIAAAPPVDPVVGRTVGTGCAVCSELLVVADGTHTWPGTSRGVSGLQPGSFDLNSLLVAAARGPNGGLPHRLAVRRLCLQRPPPALDVHPAGGRSSHR